MPLNKSGSKKAFSENVRTEMHHGKPQKQALAIAYSTMRRAGHSMAKGGMCPACGNECRYADGGEVKSDSNMEQAGKAISSGISPESAQKMKSWFSPPQAEAEEPESKAKGGMVKKHEYGKVKGVHEQLNTMHPGESRAGLYARRDKEDEPDENGKTSLAYRGMAKGEHKQVLEELKDMPNPKLKGLAKGGSLEAYHGKSKLYESDEGTSRQGGLVRSSNRDREYAKTEHASYPSIHRELSRESMGKAKEEAAGKLFEEHDRPKPKLKGLADGGPVLDPAKVAAFQKSFTGALGHSKGGKVNLHDQAAKSFMDKGEHDIGSSEYALPHGLDEGGEVDESHELMEHCAHELMEAIESKDKKGILDSIKAIVLSMKGS